MTANYPTLIEAVENAKKDPESMRKITQTCMKRIEGLNPRFNAFLRVFPISTPLEKEGKLMGAPIAIKDLYDLRGYPTTAGSKVFPQEPAAENASVVERLIDHGARIIGKTNTHEIALGVTGMNPHFGDVPNPWNTDRIIGGSSSGSAAAVSLGLCLAALGTDTGGSIRIPASLSGIVGLKPTFGRVSTHGIIPLSWNLDHPGPLTNSVADAALMLTLMCGYDPLDPNSVEKPEEDFSTDLELGIEGLTFGSLAGKFIQLADPEVFEAYKATIVVFQKLNAKVVPIEMDFLIEAAIANTDMLKTDGAAYHAERLAKTPEHFGEDIRVRLNEGRDHPAVSYAHARRAQTVTKRKLEEFFKSYDALILPTTPVTAPLMFENDPLKQAKALNRFTAPFNLSGLPAISIPCGFSKDGLPIGLQIVTAAWNEKKMLRVARAFERSTNFSGLHPVL